MKKLLFLCFVLFASKISFAQSSTECIYHIQLQNFRWNYCKFIGYDTISVYDVTTGNHTRDTLVWDTAFVVWGAKRNIFYYPFPDSLLNNKEMIVTSMDGKEKYEVKKITVNLLPFAFIYFEFFIIMNFYIIFQKVWIIL